MLEEKEHSAEAADAHKADQYDDRQRYAKGAIVVFHGVYYIKGRVWCQEVF